MLAAVKGYYDGNQIIVNEDDRKNLNVGDEDCIISWNFKHIVNVKTIRGVRAITNLEGYKMIEIWNPSVLLESEE